MWLLADMIQTGMFLAGVALLLLVLLRRVYRHYGRRRTTRPGQDPYLVTTPRPAREGRSLSDAPTDVLRWHVEMQETARVLKAELDTKLRALQLLVQQAREEAERLERLLDQQASGTPGNSVEDDAEQRPEVTAATWCAAFQLIDQGRAAPDIAGQLGIPVEELKLMLRLRGSE